MTAPRSALDCLSNRLSNRFSSPILCWRRLQGQRATDALKDLRSSRSGVGPNDTSLELDMALKMEQWNLRMPMGGVSPFFFFPERTLAYDGPLRRTLSAGDLRITPSPLHVPDEPDGDDSPAALRRRGSDGPGTRSFVSRSTGNLPSDLAHVLPPRRGVQVTYDGVLRHSALDSNSSSLASGLLPHPTATFRQGQQQPADGAVEQPEPFVRPLPPAPSRAEVAAVSRRV